ncbi:sodium channel protein Nach-like [Danaus plexippus]|uniref:sodium channel protein Nach-like n=1 Tax=Danaus plexippus TaxID=13037 RepID=UPI002AB1C98A|nr:sodium channel protein Nach-like [Danaus plexippus]
MSYKTHVKEYCRNCSFGGVHFVTDDERHWTERWLWAVLVFLCWYGSALLIMASWEAFVVSPISFGVETTYKDWDTKLPTVAICEINNDDQIYNVSETIWSANHLWDLEDVLKDIAYFRGIAYRLVEVCYLPKKIDPLCPLANYSYYASLVRSSCQQLVKNCSYNDIQFDCCEYFQPIATDVGTCYIINSIQTKNPKPYPMACNLKQKEGILRFTILLTSMVYTLGEDEVPTVTTLYSSTFKVAFGKFYRRQVTMRYIENDPQLVETTPKQRACRFHDENEGGLYPFYSYSACSVKCRRDAQMDLCQCNDHFMLGTKESEICNITGMWCLHSHSSQLTTFKPLWAQKSGLICECLPSCDETEITVIKDVFTPFKRKTKNSVVELSLAYLPTERFKRNVVRSRLDLVVSLGSAAGLFVGASLLSFVELIFFFTVRLISNLCIARRKTVSIK